MTDLSKFQVAKAFRHLDPSQGLADGIAASFSSIRYRGKQWTLSHAGKTYPFKRDDDGSPLTYIDVVILGISAGLSKAYFPEWNDDSGSGPICYSLKGDVPDPGVPDRQSPSCGICDHNEWITKPGGGRGKECQDHKRMAVLLMPTMTKKMLGAPLLDPIHLKIPPGSLKSLKKFSDEIQSAGLPFASLVTRISFSLDRLFEMQFEVRQSLSDAEAPLVLPLMEDRQTRAIMGSMPEALAAPAPAKEKVETGLMEAFGSVSTPPAATPPGPPPQTATPPRPRGRPRAVPSPVINHEPVEPTPPPPATTKPDSDATDESYVESDSDIDDTLIKLLGDKMGKMLPK